MQVNVGVCTVDPRVLDKRPHFTVSQPPLDVQIAQPCDIKNPVFLLDVTHANRVYNYMHVPQWNAYYFLGEPTIIDGIRARVPGQLDPLTTYADGIKTLHAYLIRTATTADKNSYLNDRQKPAQANTHVHTYPFDASPFTANYSSDIVYLLTVVGGKHGGGD